MKIPDKALLLGLIDAGSISLLYVSFLCPFLLRTFPGQTQLATVISVAAIAATGIASGLKLRKDFTAGEPDILKRKFSSGMKRSLGVFVLSLCIFVGFLRHLGLGSAQSEEHWFKCETAAQCTILKGNCGVEWAVNKRFATASRNAPPRKDMPCTKPLEEHPANSIALCVENRCELYPSGHYAGGAPIGDDNTQSNFAPKPEHRN